jgi:enoyl-CoA hydratase/carnithine racemase
MSGVIRVERTALVATVLLDSPGKLNALSASMWRQLAVAFRELSAADDLRAVVIRGAAGNFAAGADVAEFEQIRFNRANGQRYHLETIGHALSAVESCPVPVVAAIEGVCVGGGLEIATVCDLRLASDSARLGAPVGLLGFPLALPELVPLLRLVGQATAAELLLEGRIMSGAEAAVRGLVTRAVPSAQLEAELEACIARITAGSPRAARENKVNMRRLQANGLQYDGDQLERSFAFMESSDYHEGVRAFLAKRKPNFLGR